jgi:hypothetical protein
MLTDLERSERDISLRDLIATGADLKRRIGELHVPRACCPRRDRTGATQREVPISKDPIVLLQTRPVFVILVAFGSGGCTLGEYRIPLGRYQHALNLGTARATRV